MRFLTHSLSYQTSTTLMNLMWSLRDKLIHWDHDYQYCEFQRESNTLYQAPSYTSSTSNHVHHGQSVDHFWKKTESLMST